MVAVVGLIVGVGVATDVPVTTILDVPVTTISVMLTAALLLSHDVDPPSQPYSVHVLAVISL